MNLSYTVAAAAVALLGFALYVQFSPTMGNIWLRDDHQGLRTFAPHNLLRLMAEPLRVWTPVGRAFWCYPQLWIVNWPLWLLMAAVVVGFCPY